MKGQWRHCEFADRYSEQHRRTECLLIDQPLNYFSELKKIWGKEIREQSLQQDM